MFNKTFIGGKKGKLEKMAVIAISALLVGLFTFHWTEVSVALSMTMTQEKHNFSVY